MSNSAVDSVTITATEVTAPPPWALLERRLISLMEQAAAQFMEKYVSPGGKLFFVHDVDDEYESIQNWGSFYAIGGDEQVLEWGRQRWEATTRYYDERFADEPGPRHPMFMPQLRNEFWNLTIPYNSDWYHMGEGCQAFYGFGLADPTVSENVRRARRFAELYLGDDPETPNYDRAHKIIRSPYHGGAGPLLHAKSDVAVSQSGGGTTDYIDWIRAWLQPGSVGDYSHRLASQPGRNTLYVSTLYPVVKDLTDDWHLDPNRREEIVKLFDEMVLSGDVPMNLGAAALVTNAYLYTGEQRYKDWVLEYVGAWLERTRQNGGIVPDNIGLTGKIGERREGLWWGGLRGWNCGWGARYILEGTTIGAQCAHLLSGDSEYLELSRSVFRFLRDNAIEGEGGQLMFPDRYGPEGWISYQPASTRIHNMAHLYHASMSAEDHDLIAAVRDGDVERDWNQSGGPGGDRGGGGAEYGRFQYYAGHYPKWPEDTLRHEIEHVENTIAMMGEDDRDFDTILFDNRWPPDPADPDERDGNGEQANPIVMKGLTQVAMGAPPTYYYGGLLRATLRYFDQDRGRPGLPLDVAAHVGELKDDGASVQLVNTGCRATRKVIVQAGAFGEHSFTEASYSDSAGEKTVPLGGRHVVVELPPSTSIRLRLGLKRFDNDPSYAFPWHGRKVPALLQ